MKVSFEVCLVFVLSAEIKHSLPQFQELQTISLVDIEKMVIFGLLLPQMKDIGMRPKIAQDGQTLLHPQVHTQDITKH